MAQGHRNSAEAHLHGSEYMISYSTIKLLNAVFANELKDYHFGVSQFEEELHHFGL